MCSMKTIYIPFKEKELFNTNSHTEEAAIYALFKPQYNILYYTWYLL